MWNACCFVFTSEARPMSDTEIHPTAHHCLNSLANDQTGLYDNQSSFMEKLILDINVCEYHGCDNDQ